MKRAEFICAALVASIIVGAGILALWSKSQAYSTSPVQSAPICQYPDRWTNPPNGCDNSDPAVPECIKEFSTEQGERDCIERFVAQNQPVQVPEPLPMVEGK